MSDLSDHANDVFDSTRALARSMPQVMAAPMVYSVLGNVNNSAYALASASSAMGVALGRSLAELDVYDHSRPAGESVDLAQAALDLAARHLRTAGESLSQSQTAINRQGYNVS